MRLKTLILATALGLSTHAMAGPLASVFSDHAVLQRDQPIKLWGQAAPNAPVEVDLSGTRFAVTADGQGRWSAVLPSRPAGGDPLTLTVQAGAERQVVSDLAMGDVWLCSGQSNMEYPLRRSLNGDGEAASAGDPDIRLLRTGKISKPAPQSQLPAGVVWKVSTPETAADFSAACFFMGRELRKTARVPIGLIDATWGGSVIQDWISREGVSALKTYDEGLAVLSDYARDPATGQARWAAMLDRWAAAKLGAANDGQRPDLDDRTWKTLPMEGFWENSPGLETFDGVIWLRTEVTLTKAQAAQGAILALGPIDDIDTTFVNGREIGASQGWDTPREYRLAPGALKAGRNLIAIRAVDTGGGGGPWGKAAEKGLRLDDGTLAPLGGAWRYRIAAPLSRTALPPSAPWLGASGLSTLRNGMIAPLAPYGVKGFAWYQGEANVTEAAEYARLMPAMIADWRQAFGDGAPLPFLMVQLAAFGAEKDRPAPSDWAALRDVQRRTAAADPTVGMASAVDIGSPYDIHPADKLRVGQRLALLARKLAYGEAGLVAAGPAPVSARREGGEVVVTLDQPAVVHAAGRPIGFELCDAGETCRFVDASLEGTGVRLAVPAGAPTVKVRYAWADSPIINLFGANGLPATPFELAIP